MKSNFNTLYGKDKNGKIKEWRIYVENKNVYSNIVCIYGGLNDKKIETIRKIESGKNKGKKNETTHYEQACLEAESKWKKKKDLELYTEDIKKLEDTNEKEKIILPMLAQDYTKHKKKIEFPCYTQPKLDGYRAVCIKGKMCSRQGKEFEVMRNYFKELKDEDYILDGELYNHNIKFEELGILRKKLDKIKTEDLVILNKIEYHIYDIVDETLSFKERMLILEALKKKYNNGGSIKIVKTEECKNTEEIEEQYRKVILEGYEGLMIRNANANYKCKNRSYDLQKYKEFMDDEFKIVGFEKEQGDLVVWVCETKKGQKFNVQSKGTREERKELYIEGEKYIGENLWVQFFEYTADGIPRFPKTMRGGKESIRIIKL